MRGLMPNIFGCRMTRSRVAESFGLGTSLYNKALLQKCSVYQNARDTKMLDYQKAQIQKCSMYQNAQLQKCTTSLASLLVVSFINTGAQDAVVSLSAFPTSPAEPTCE